MVKINPHYARLSSPYIFPIIEEKLAVLTAKEPLSSLVNLGIGDIALPLAPIVVEAICKATEEMSHPATLRGYGPSEGYPFLRSAIAESYTPFDITAEEIFISDGTNSDTVNLQELFAADCRVAIPDPTYPVYLAANTMAGRKDYITLLPCTAENGFLPQPPSYPVDIIYLCSPSNPTGVAMGRSLWEKWIDYAKRENAIIIHDHAYAAFVRSVDIPRSIYEIPGAKEVAIECCSFSKGAGFTGLRCAYTVVPRSLPHNLHAMWKKRQTTKSNGVAYPIQKGAAATLSPVGKQQVNEQVDIYRQQAEHLYTGLTSLGYTCYGGIDAPYIWWKTPHSLNSWEFFDLLLNQCRIIAIPGQGFGESGEGYVRLSAFTTPEKTQEALCRIRKL